MSFLGLEAYDYIGMRQPKSVIKLKTPEVYVVLINLVAFICL